MSSTKQLFANNAATTVALPGVSPTDTQITVADASKFNNPAGSGRYIKVTLENSGVIEVVKISNISGNVLTVFNGLAGRAQEGTIAATFPVGAKVENRTTAGTLAEFLTAGNYLPKLASADGLSVPTEMDSTAYMAGKDDGGALILAYADTNVLWNFPAYRRVTGLTGTTTSGSTTTAVIGANSLAYVAGKYIIQFTNGPNQGYCRAITSVAGTAVGWSTALPASVTTYTYEIYQSTYSVTSGFTLPDADIKYRGNATTADGATFTVITSPSFTSFIDGLEVKAYMSGTNYGSTAPALVASGTPSRTIVKLDDKPLALSELKGEVVFRYNLSLNKWVYVSGAAVSPGPELQLQSSTAFTTTGSGSAFVLSPTPASVGNIANTRFRIKFHAAATGTPTLNVSSGGSVGLRFRHSNGSKQFCSPLQVPIDWISDVEFDGTDWMLLDRADTLGVPEAQHQSITAFTTTNTGAAYVLTPVPAIASLATNSRFRVKFHAQASGTPTLNVSGTGAVTLKYRDSNGTKQTCTSLQIATNHISDVEYDGTDWMLLDRRDSLGAFEYQYQLNTAFTTATSATNFTLSPSPAWPVNTVNKRFRVKFHAAVVGTPTLNVSSAGAANLMYTNSSGTKVACTAVQIPINWISDVEFDGTDWVLLQRADRAGTSTAQSFTAAQRGSIVALTDAATVASDFALSNNFSLTIAGNRTLGTPSNLVAGQSGIITITQDATGTRTLAYTTAWKFSNGSIPALSTAANAIDQLAYYVNPGATTIFASLTKDVKNP